MTRAAGMSGRTTLALVSSTVLLGSGVYYLATGRGERGATLAFIGAVSLVGITALVRGGKPGTVAMLAVFPTLGVWSIATSISHLSLLGLALGAFMLVAGVVVFTRWRRGETT